MAVCDIPLQWKHVGDGNYILKIEYDKPSIGYYGEFSEETTMNDCCKEVERNTGMNYVYDVVVVSKSTKKIVFNESRVCKSRKDAEKLALADLASKHIGDDLDDFILDLHFAISQVGDGFETE